MKAVMTKSILLAIFLMMATSWMYLHSLFCEIEINRNMQTGTASFVSRRILNDDTEYLTKSGSLEWLDHGRDPKDLKHEDIGLLGRYGLGRDTECDDPDWWDWKRRGQQKFSFPTRLWYRFCSLFFSDYYIHKIGVGPYPNGKSEKTK